MRVSKSEILDSERALQTMVLCNDLEGPVDIAMWENARQLLNGDPQQMVDASQRLEEELFTSETKYMITAITGNMFQGQSYNFLKGAPEIVMGMCQIEPAEKTRFLALVDQWAGEGLRMIGWPTGRSANWMITAAIPGWAWLEWKTRCGRAWSRPSRWLRRPAFRSR